MTNSSNIINENQWTDHVYIHEKTGHRAQITLAADYINDKYQEIYLLGNYDAKFKCLNQIEFLKVSDAIEYLNKHYSDSIWQKVELATQSKKKKDDSKSSGCSSCQAH